MLVIDRSVSDGVIRQTKTNERRTVEVAEPLAEDLDRHRPKVADPDALVCSGERGRVIDLNNWRRRVWIPACEAAGVRTTPYDGRHTYASLLIHEGRSLPYVTAALGHASATTTLRHYVHMIDEARLATGVPMVVAIRPRGPNLSGPCVPNVYPAARAHAAHAAQSGLTDESPRAAGLSGE